MAETSVENAGPPEEAFWDRYNARSEFPLSTVLSVLIHVVAAVVIVFVLFRLMNQGADRVLPPTKVIDVNGFDDEGSGKAGSGGTENPLKEDNTQPLKAAMDALPPTLALPEAKADLQQRLKELDPTATIPVADANAVAWAVASKTLQEKLMGVGGTRGNGNNPGSGDSAQPGDGKGGTGANSSRARSLRWVLRFRTSSGRDYLDQIGAMGAVVAVPLPPNEEKLLLFENLNDPSNKHIATDAEVTKLAERLKFSDVRRESVRQVGDALRLDFPARSFWAFFPRKLEEELARKETSYRNRRAEDIEETTFQVTIRGGSYDIVVYEQRAR